MPQNMIQPKHHISTMKLFYGFIAFFFTYHAAVESKPVAPVLDAYLPSTFIEIQDESPCDSLSDLNLVAPTDFNLLDAYFCYGDSLKVDFPKGDYSNYSSFSWFQAGVFLSTDSAIVIHEEDTFSLALYGCDTLELSFESLYFTAHNGESLLTDLTICEGDTAEVRFPKEYLTGYNTFRWFSDGEFYSSSLGVVSVTEPGTYILELYGCDTIQDAFVLSTIPVNNTPYSFPDTTICPAEENYVSFPEDDFASYESFSWLHNGAFYSSDSTVLFKDEGVNELAFVGCKNRSESFYVSFPYAFVPEYYFQSLCIGDSVAIAFDDDVHELYPDIAWFRDGNLFSDSTSLSTNDIGSYQIEFYGCDTLVRNFEVAYTDADGCDCQISMPNVFTPNGDGVNDVFMPKYIHEDAEDFDICTTTVYQLELFNQWGKNVFSSKTDKELPQWDGENSRNTNLREGLYFYKIQYQLNTYPEGVNHNMSGYFQIYR